MDSSSGDGMEPAYCSVAVQCSALSGNTQLLLLLRLEDLGARQTMISWCHHSDAGTSHRDREPICFGVQCSKISSARRRMCRNPCTVFLLQYHLHTLSFTDVPTAKRRCGAVVKEVFDCAAVCAANERGSTVSLASLTKEVRSAQGPARLGISSHHPPDRHAWP